MTSQGYSTTSLYATTQQNNAYGINYLDVWAPPVIVASSSDTFITLDARYNTRPDLLSYDYYQTTGYWWVFMIRNPDVISDPIWDFKTGIQIYVPVSENLPRSII